MRISDDTEPLRKRFKCNRVYDDFSSDDEMPTLRSKWTLRSKTIKHHLLNKEKRKPIKSSTMKASNVLQMLSENKELSVTRTPAAVQPVLDEETAGCSQSYNINISIKPAETVSKKSIETYEINSDDEIDSKVNKTENISDTKMVYKSSINLEEREENDNNCVETESFDEWLKKLKAKHEAFMESSRKSINDIIRKYSVPNMCADDNTPGHRSSIYENLLSKSDPKYDRTDSTSSNMSIEPNPTTEDNSNPLSESPEELNSDNTEQNLAGSFKTETFDEWKSRLNTKLKLIYNINSKISESTVSDTMNKNNEENVLQSQTQSQTKHKLMSEKSEINDSNENIVLQVNNEHNQTSLNQPSCLTNQLKLDSQYKQTVQMSTIASKDKENDEGNEVCSSAPDLILRSSKRLERDLRILQNSKDTLIGSKSKNDLAKTILSLYAEENQKSLNLPDLTLEQKELINTALNSPPDKVLIEKFKLKIYKEDLETLSERNWLNDKVIDFYMNLIMERSEERNNLPKVYAMNTSFYPKLMMSGHDGLKRWTRKVQNLSVDIFSYDLLVIPVHLTNHWCVSFINFRTRKIEYLDSRGRNKENCLIALLQYLKDEHQDKKGEPFNDSGWERECLKNIPEQRNSRDCGIFVCTFAEFESRNAAYTFTQAQMPYLRRKAALEILTGKLLL
uniref:SFRICE_003373 n=1 Tax=Spodoptera frugiperda TaxID=7108 RepID=A0A2H1V9R3_SPOFR